MPIDPKMSRDAIIEHQIHGPQYERTKKKHGKQKAIDQAVAIGYAVKRRRFKRKKKD